MKKLESKIKEKYMQHKTIFKSRHTKNKNERRYNEVDEEKYVN